MLHRNCAPQRKGNSSRDKNDASPEAFEIDLNILGVVHAARSNLEAWCYFNKLCYPGNFVMLSTQTTKQLCKALNSSNSIFLHFQFLFSSQIVCPLELLGAHAAANNFYDTNQASEKEHLPGDGTCVAFIRCPICLRQTPWTQQSQNANCRGH